MKKVFTISILILSLILVRVFQYDLFYDPFLSYFKNSYLSGDFPDIDWAKMSLFLFFRYAINSSISLLIIHLIFNNKEYLKFSLIIYIISFFILIPIYFYYISIHFENGYLPAFYIRRFIIQPLLLFLLVPALFYQNKQTSTEK